MKIFREYMYIIRDPVAAGVFYNSDKFELAKEIESCFKHKLGPKEIKTQNVIAAIVPHDKLHLSGYISAWAYSKFEKANYIILGANHKRIGVKFAVMKEGLWKTPLGEIAINRRVAEKIINKSKIAQYDVTAHENEHSIENQLPFLQYRFGSDFNFVPISITNVFSDENFLEQCKSLGKAIADTTKAEKEKWIIIASTDFLQGTKNYVEKTDKQLINLISSLDEKKILKEISEKNIFICGYGAILTTILSAKELGAKKVKVLSYGTSFDILRDPNSVTGYASIIFY